MTPSMPEPLARLAAAAVVQRATWDARDRDVPLAHPLRVDADEVVLELTDGSLLIFAAPGSVPQVRADLRRWGSLFDGDVCAVLSLPAEASATLLEEPPARPRPGLRVVVLDPIRPLWNDDAPALINVLLDAASRRPPPPADLLDRLRHREDRTWPPRASPPSSDRFERIVYALAQAHELVHRVQGEARLDLLDGGELTVLAASGDPQVDDAALAAALANLVPGLVRGTHGPSLLVVDGPDDLSERVRAIMGSAAVAHGRVHACRPDGSIHPPDPHLQEIVRLAQGRASAVDLWSELELGLARVRGIGLDRHAEHAGEARIGLVSALLDALPSARLRWLGATQARIGFADREVRVRWVGPEGAAIEPTIADWRLAFHAAAFTGKALDLVLVGGDVGTWQQARRALPARASGGVHHLTASGEVRTHRVPLGPVSPIARALRGWARRPAEQRRQRLDDLRAQIERMAVADFRDMVADAEFQRKLFRGAPWATRIGLLAIGAGYAAQLTFEATTGPGAVRMGALTGEGLLSGEPWRWFAAAFLHAGIWHVGLNAWALWILGRRLEALIGPYRMGALFLLSCLGGSVLHEAFASPGDIAVGASTGILGLLAAQGALVLTRPDLAPSRIRRLLWREAWINGLLISAISLLPFVGGLAHLGGALAGFILIASGLLTRGVTPGDAQSPGPTRISTTQVGRNATMMLGGIAAGCVALSISLGQPWALQQPSGRMRDVSVYDGAMTVPLPGTAAVERTELEAGGARVVSAGDPLRDGVRVWARATPLGSGAPEDLDLLIALRGPAGRQWTYIRKGDGPVAWSSPSPPPDSLIGILAPSDRLARRSFVALRDGVFFRVEVTGTADVVRTRLSGTWDRIPAGLAAHADAWPATTQAIDVDAFFALVDGEPIPPLDGLPPERAALLRAIDAVRAGRTPVDFAPREPERALALAELLGGYGATDLALAWLDALAPHVRADARQRSRARVLEEGLRPAEALDALDHTASVTELERAALLWHDGRTDRAAELAASWLAGARPWWMRTSGADDALPPAWHGNVGWAHALTGDAEACIASSRAAIDARADLSFARYNLGLCLLLNGDLPDARDAYRRADADARAVGSPALRRAAARDLLRLVRDDVSGARDQYQATFGDLYPLPGYALPQPTEPSDVERP